MKARIFFSLFAVLALGACDGADPAALDEAQSPLASNVDVPAPTPLVTVAAPGSALELWPFTSPTLGGPMLDPINLLFPGVDVRTVRAALLMVDGDRAAFGFPDEPPFNCTWKEAMAANQAGYSTPGGWTGSAIQLECGDYGPARFHVRMFPAGDWTMANGHFEVLIGGTNQHEVLSWELTEQLVLVDFLRSGVIAGAPAFSQPITPTPDYRAINPLVFNQLPLDLQLLTTGVPGPAAAPVPIPNDGVATILPFQDVGNGDRMVARREFVLDFNQTIPKPFCASGPLDYLMVTGPITFKQQVVVSASGTFMTWFHARGQLELVPVNPVTQETGAPFRAQVAEHDRSVVTDQVTLVSTFQMQLLLPRNRPESGSLFATLRIGPGGADGASLEITCAA